MMATAHPSSLVSRMFLGVAAVAAETKSKGARSDLIMDRLIRGGVQGGRWTLPNFRMQAYKEYYRSRYGGEDGLEAVTETTFMVDAHVREVTHVARGRPSSRDTSSARFGHLTSIRREEQRT